MRKQNPTSKMVLEAMDGKLPMTTRDILVVLLRQGWELSNVRQPTNAIRHALRLQEKKGLVVGYANHTWERVK